MTSDAPPEPPPLPTTTEPARKPWQFSMRTMMLGMSGFAILCGLATALPTNVSMTLIGLIWLGVSGWLITGLLFASGDQRAFCVGATLVFATSWSISDQRLLPSAIQLVTYYLRDLDLAEGLTLWLVHMVIAIIAVANGYLCIRARRYFERHTDD